MLSAHDEIYPFKAFLLGRLRSEGSPCPAAGCVQNPTPLSQPESGSEGVPVSSGKGPSFKLLLSSVCQSWGWKEWKVPFGGIVGTTRAALNSWAQAAGQGLVSLGDPGEWGWREAGLTQGKTLKKGSFHLLLFLLLQHWSRAVSSHSSVSVCSTSAVQNLWCG